MANIDWFDTFNYAWGQNGNTDAYDEAEYKLGWAFLGNQPPTVEQFNEQGQIWDKKQKWLYDQMVTIANEHGVTVAELDTDLLKNVLLDYAALTGGANSNFSTWPQINGTGLQDAFRTATTTAAGTVEKATTAEAENGTADKYPDAAGVVSAIQNNNASETTAGTAELATQAETDALTDDKRIITPKKLWNWAKFVAGTTANTIAKRDSNGRIQAADPNAAQDVATLAWAQRQFSQPSTTGSATFTKLTNNIQLTNVVPDLSLQKGDVIEVSGTANNDNLYTVESITDDDNIIVNYEHRNGAGPRSLTGETANCTIKRIAKHYEAPSALGRAIIDLTPSRANGITYTNSSGREMQVIAGGSWAAGSYNFSITIDGVTTNQATVGTAVVIPSGSTYRLDWGSSAYMTSWSEIR